MSTDPRGPHPEDLPWNDVPADDEALPGTIEPDPAEVVGDETTARDRASRQVRDPNQRESLDERLAEELPDEPAHGEPSPEAAQLVDAVDGEDEVEPAEPDVEDPAEHEDAAAEDAAVHVVDDDRVL
jgi:hypothetical protein